MGLFAESINYLLSHQGDFITLLREHLVMVVVAELAAILVAIPLAIAATQHPQAKRLVMGFGNLAQTIPTLGVIAIVFPLLGIGFAPSVFGIWLYALFPIITNTITGIEDVDDDILEAAKGMGMTKREQLQKVELPLALPVIFGGIRTSSVLNVGTAYLAFFIGGGGLGVWVVSGITQFDNPKILAGAIPGALLAITADRLFGAIEKRLSENMGVQADAATA
ncbi:ABC transporter permease [Halorarius halobius]|uniref:ABC transporter permease n=1 Tax=Halorarius halobius TaxID=2962671 RepID=UPI0020CFCA45|nr:ABC transporter permease [Halorarius halobius]